MLFCRLLLLPLMVLPLAALAQETTVSGPTIPLSQTYKGEEVAVVHTESKYGGEIYTSDLYTGDIEGPAYAALTDRSLHDGFYMGLGAGYDSFNLRNSLNVVQNGITVFQQNPNLNAVGMTYSILGGFGRTFDNPLYIGVEVFYNDAQANTSQSVDFINTVQGTYYVKSVILDTYGASLMPGFKLTDSALLYLKVGYTRVDLRTYETAEALGVNNAQTQGCNGVHFGLGLEVNAYKLISIRGEYTHMNGQSVTTATGDQISPSDNQVMLALIWHFI